MTKRVTNIRVFLVVVVLVTLACGSSLAPPAPEQAAVEQPGAQEEYYYEEEVPAEAEEMVGDLPTAAPPEYNTEEYDRIYENEFLDALSNPLSTFSIDVDTASYSNARRFINDSRFPPQDAVRIEEFINYFNYDYPSPQDEHPFSISTELSECPWNRDHKLLHIGLQAKKISLQELPPNNLTFLLDVSGSMSYPNKLPLLKSTLELLVNEMREIDSIAIVVYAGAAGMVLPPTSGINKKEIIPGLLT